MYIMVILENGKCTRRRYSVYDNIITFAFSQRVCVSRVEWMTPIMRVRIISS